MLEDYSVHSMNVVLLTNNPSFSVDLKSAYDLGHPITVIHTNPEDSVEAQTLQTYATRSFSCHIIP